MSMRQSLAVFTIAATASTLIAAAFAVGALNADPVCDTPMMPRSATISYDGGGGGSYSLRVVATMEAGGCSGPVEAVVVRGSGSTVTTTLVQRDDAADQYAGTLQFEESPAWGAASVVGAYAVTNIRTAPEVSPMEFTDHIGPEGMWDTANIIRPKHTITAADAGPSGAIIYWDVVTGSIPGFKQQIAYGFYDASGKPVEAMLPLAKDVRSHTFTGFPADTAIGICLVGSNDLYGPIGYDLRLGAGQRSECAIIRTPADQPVILPDSNPEPEPEPESEPEPEPVVRTPPLSSSPLKALPPLRSPSTAIIAQPTPLPSIPPPPRSEPIPFPIPLPLPPTDPPTIPPTDPPTVPPTDPPTIPPTDPPIVPPTDPPTIPPTVPPTIPPTIPPTDPPTLPPTIPPTDPPIEPPPPPPLDPPTIPPTDPPTIPPGALG